LIFPARKNEKKNAGHPRETGGADRRACIRWIAGEIWHRFIIDCLPWPYGCGGLFYFAEKKARFPAARRFPALEKTAALG
jgi:hypothetical protein